MRILGLSCFYHDAAAALVVDGRVVAAAQEERFTRVKHDPAYPRHAIDAVLATAGLSRGEIDAVAFYEKPLIKLDRVLETTAATAPEGLRRWVDSLPRWFTERLQVESTVAQQLGREVPFFYASHHEAHAASAFFPSPFQEAATLTLDGVGEWTTNAIGHGVGNRVRLLQDIRFPHSLGLLYSAFTQFLGFRVNEGEYKVMGLAPYGQPRFVDLILAHLVDVRDDGSYALHLDAFDFLAGDSTISTRFENLFGRAARATDAPLETFHMDVARSIQAVTEQIVLAQARHAAKITQSRNLVLAGGVALNCVANGKLLRSGLFENVFVPPAAGDAGGAVGAALVAWHHVHDGPRRPVDGEDGLSGSYLGPSFTAADVDEALTSHGLTGSRLAEPDLYEAVAGLIDEGAVVGWVQGRMEFGPRALGHRSILADPRRAENQSRVNQSVKFREGFRPFAPAVLAEHVSTWFDLDRPSPYMLFVAPVAAAQRVALTEAEAAVDGLDRLKVRRSTLPAITHVDGSARVQTVDGRWSPAFRGLLEAFHRRTGVPVLLNTSFNLKDEPIVCTPADAVATFLASGMDALVVGDVLVHRPIDRPATGKLPSRTPPPREVPDAWLAQFGVGGGALLAVLAGVQVAADRPRLAMALGVVATGLAAFGAFAPRRLRRVEGVASHVGHAIGRVNAALLFGALFLAVVTPIARLRAWRHGDPLRDRRATAGEGWWRAMSHNPDDRDAYSTWYRS